MQPIVNEKPGAESPVPIPPVGLGTWKIPKPDLPALIRTAAETGYRHFDCACDYGNEPQVGAGLQDVFRSGVCRRDDVWITSKLWNTYHAARHVRPALERTLADLKVDSLDLYLVHFPIPLRFVPFDHRYPPEWVYDPEADHPRMELAPVPFAETWQAMEDVMRAGLTRRIGVCNVGVTFLRDLLTYADVPPAVLQVELHPYLTQPRLLRFCRESAITVTAFSPLGSSSYVPLGMAEGHENVLADDAVTETAAALGKTAAQVVLRWGIQRGTAVIPKTANPSRLAENLDVLGFELTNPQMRQLDALNRNRRFNDPGDFCEQAFGTFCPIFD